MINNTLEKTVCLHELFEAQVDLHPSKLAVICEKRRMTYQELEEHSNKLAHYLRSFGVGSGTFVGIYLTRSEKHIIAILAILKAGATYVPVDSSYPMERVNHIIRDTKMSMLVTERNLSTRVSSVFNGTSIILDADSAIIDRQPIDRIMKEVSNSTPDNLCYIIYTSGTTGQPKGIMTEHRNVVQFLSTFSNVCQLNNTDRIYQGFSLGFDGSVEEIWMAFYNGATLIVGTNEVAGFALETATLINETGVTFFSTVPTFLSMIKDNLPTVRIIVVSGEQCPHELVSKWTTNNRRVLNVYGPTETTVNTTVEECKPEKPITIGKALPGYTTYILDTQMEKVKQGEPGELYIGGVGVARGYLNQRELTNKYFLKNPFNGSEDKPSYFYRTGDLVYEDKNKDLIFLGRIDNQVKIRGFRIELSEIESVLGEHSAVNRAIASVIESQGNKELAAYIVKNKADQTINRNEILNLLQNRLPSYMIPKYLDIIDEIPTLSSGKVDRKKLPKVYTPLVRISDTIVKPSTDLEQNITDIYKKVFSVETLSMTDDFFLDLGGHSLLAAQVVSLLRNDMNISQAAIRDIYRYPTIKQFAKHLDSLGYGTLSGPQKNNNIDDIVSSKSVFKNLSKFTYWCTVGLQGLSLTIFYGFGTIPFVITYLIYSAVTNGRMSILSTFWISAAFFFGMYPLLFIIGICTKWLIIGRYKPGKYPLWGFYYFRWWLVSRFQMLSGAGFLEGTPLINLYYRLMGAKIGRNCILDTSNCSAFDLVDIGEGTSIGSDTSLHGYKIVNGMLVIGNIHIGNNCFIGMHSTIGIHTSMGDNSCLDDLSALSDGECMEQGESRGGSPSIKTNVKVPQIPKNRIQKRHPVFFGLLHLISIYAIEIFLITTAIPSIVLLYSAYKTQNVYYWIVIIIASIPLFEVCFCIFLTIVKIMVLPRTKPGIYTTESIFYVRKWFVDSLFNLSRLLILPVYTTLYFPPWLRMLGAKIGKRVELSIVGLTSPDLLVAKDESFFADGSIIGGNRYYRGYFEITQNTIGCRSFIGNNALIPNSIDVGNECLVGVLSIPPIDKKRVPDKSEWLGSPSFRLPHRQKIEGFTEQETYNPTKLLVLHRLCIDTLRIFIPSIIEIIGLITLIFLIHIVCTTFSLPLIIALSSIIGMFTSISMALLVVIVKNVIIGTYTPTIKPLWSPYVWLNEVVNGAYESVGAPMLLPMLGTPFFKWYLQLLGCKIGKHVYMGTTLLGEFDLVEIGDYSAINAGVVLQNHLFEDRIFKASHLKIGNECSVGNNSVILYDTEMKHGSSIGALSLLMKGEIVPPNTSWSGIPTEIQTKK